MAIGSISAVSLGQYVLSSSDANQIQQALQNLQNSLASGDLKSAQSSFQTVLRLNQTLAAASGSGGYSNSQLSTHLTALGSALGSGDLSTAQSAFATVQADLKNANSPSQTNETNAASQAKQIVAELLSSLNSNGASASPPDNTSSVLEKVYGSRNTLNVSA